jgi:hypothetical protein
VTAVETVAGTATPTAATVAGPLSATAGEADVAALAAYGLDAEGNPVVADAAATSVAPPAPRSVFVDADGNEYHLTVAAPAMELPASAPTEAPPAL